MITIPLPHRTIDLIEMGPLVATTGVFHFDRQAWVERAGNEGKHFGRILKAVAFQIFGLAHHVHCQRGIGFAYAFERAAQMAAEAVNFRLG
jgi:hypothetical protein